MFCALLTSRYQVSVYRINGPLVFPCTPKITYKIWLKMVSEKSKFQFLYVNNLRQRSRNDLDLQYSLSFT